MDGSVENTFTMDNADIPPYCAHDDLKRHPIDQPSTKRLLNGIVPKSIKEELTAFLESRKATKKANKLENDRKSSKKKKSKVKKGG